MDARWGENILKNKIAKNNNIVIIRISHAIPSLSLGVRFEGTAGRDLVATLPLSHHLSLRLYNPT